MIETAEITAMVTRAVAGMIAVNVALFVATFFSSWKLFTWRLAKVEEKIERHNKFGDRLTKVETQMEAVGK